LAASDASVCFFNACTAVCFVQSLCAKHTQTFVHMRHDIRTRAPCAHA
jgi:hypothetical protein